MIQLFKKIYLNKTVFLVLIAELASLFPLSVLMCAMSEQMNVFYGFIYGAIIILIVSLFSAYRRHDLILMNGLISAIMIIEILRYAFVIGSYIQMGTETIVSDGFMSWLLPLSCFAYFFGSWLGVTRTKFTFTCKDLDQSWLDSFLGQGWDVKITHEKETIQCIATAQDVVFR